MIWKPWTHPAYGDRDFIRISTDPNNAWISVFKSRDKWWINSSIWARDWLTPAVDSKLRKSSGDNSEDLMRLVDEQLTGLGHILVNDNKKLIML